MTNMISERLDRILGDAQGCTLNTNTCKEIIKVLEYDDNVKQHLIEKLLNMCIRDPKDDVQYATAAFNVIKVILRKATMGKISSDSALFPSMLELLNLLKTSIYSCTSDHIKVMYFEILILYPDEVCQKLEEESEILELFNLYFHQRIPIELRLQPINVLHKFLKILPPDKRKKLVEEGINIWIVKLVPSIMSFATTPDIDIETSLDTLEMIANECVNIDYSDNPNWEKILQCFCEGPKYPNIMKNLLINGNQIWHRLWIIFIKLLKNQLTKSGSSGSPINSMLPVVERAFKMDYTTRCHAFECWSALIENFGTETNESYVHKRVKLLVIPLYANNAKTEETAIPKIKSWWLLIRRYCLKLNNFYDVILHPFLQFCFGNPIGDESDIVPGAFTNKTKELSVEAFVNIIGHYNCAGCVSLPVGKDKILNEKYLCTNMRNIIYYIKVAIKYVESTPITLRRPLKCAWISFAKLICDVPNLDMRRNLFTELLTMLENLLQGPFSETLADIILNDLLLTLFEFDDQLLKLLNTGEKLTNPWNMFYSIILSPSFDSVYNKYAMAEAVNKYKRIADFIINNFFHISSNIEAFLTEMSANYKSLVLWTVLTSSICERKCDAHSQIRHKFLLWPLNHLECFTREELSTSLWLDLFDLEDTKDGTTIDDEVFERLYGSKDINASNSLFFLKVAIRLLSKKVIADETNQYQKQVCLVHDILNKIDSFSHTDPVFGKVIDILSEILKKLLKYINLNMAKYVLMILKYMFTQLLAQKIKPGDINEEFCIRFDQLWQSIKDLLKREAYASLKNIVLTDLLEFGQWFAQISSLKITILDTLQMSLNSMDSNNPLFNSAQNVIESLKHDSSYTIDKSKFTTPVSKKAKKKDTSIVNTVVEDGEEFVVVKSNWKFNPKKLTDNQKEKLQRKREDIPALYQDLSQSQDDFKLRTWKTDSQDTTTTTTSSKSNDLTSEKVSSILKNMPNTDVVPKILKNILTENNEKISVNLESKSENINETQTPTQKAIKPKLALKDRISRNVKSLIEKSNGQNLQKPTKSSIDDVTTALQTPDMKNVKLVDAVINSAPSEINSERPSRVKRKPKKFAEMQVFATKKRRHSQGNSESQTIESFEDINQRNEVIESSEINKLKVNPSDTVLEDQENHNIQVSNSVEGLINHNVEINTQTENILDIVQEQVQQENSGDQQKSSKTNIVPTTKTSLQNYVENSIAVNISTGCVPNNQKNCDELGTKEDNSFQKVKTIKNMGKKKSRIEKELAIDMVEGHPFLKVQSEKRLTRKMISESPVVSKRKSLNQRLNKSKIDTKSAKEEKPQVDKKVKEIDSFSDSQEHSFKEEHGSQDIIESSQDSTVSISSVKSTKTFKRVPMVTLQNFVLDKSNPTLEDDSFLDNTNKSEKYISANSRVINNSISSICKNNDVSEFPLNKTAVEYIQIDLTENLDTQPTGKVISEEITVINDSEDPPVAINFDDTYVEMDTQDIADADTQPMDPNAIQSCTNETLKHVTNEIVGSDIATNKAKDTKILDTELTETLEKIQQQTTFQSNLVTSTISAQDACSKSLTESLLSLTETKQDENASKLSLEDEEQRKQDFLNNTLEISPIKTLSPVRENKSPSETSSDYVVIKLSSPVQSNGEPYEKCDSPEIFTEDKVSPDKRDQSPPREETRVSTASPRSLSLKKNKPQVRSGGRAAQMLGLCVPTPERLQTILNLEKNVEPEEQKKCNPLNSSARRNLRILYTSTNDSHETTDENEENKNFLKMKRSLPAADSSPSVPILKRKLADIVDDGTVSPVSKRKRVSFHDPPVSTTICVKKYIEPCSVRSPQNSATKRQERQLHPQMSSLKSPKRLDTVFKLDKALIKAVESFDEDGVTPNATEDTEMSSLEPTPLLEVVKNRELNDIDPICLDLINCKDPIDNIAGDLSSSAMRPLLVKEFAGKIETIGDLAKLTELEVNRLCIKAPKVQIAKKVLLEYGKKIKIVGTEVTPTTEAALSESTVIESNNLNVEMPLLATKPLIVSEVSSKTETVHDLAEKAELEVISPCVEMSEVPVTEKVVMEHATEINIEANDMTPTTEAAFSESSVAETNIVDVEMQTDCVALDSIEVQTESLAMSVASTQTKVNTAECEIQTNESGSRSTVDIVKSLLEKPDYCERLNELLDLTSKESIASTLPLNALMNNVLQKNDKNQSSDIIDMLLEKHTSDSHGKSRLSFMRDYLSKSFGSQDLILLCSELLKKVHDNI